MIVGYDNNIWCVLVRIISFIMQNEQFPYSPICYVTDLISDDLHEKSEIQKEMWVPGNSLLSESVIFLRKITWHRQRCIVTYFVTVRRFTYAVIDQFPDLTWKWKCIMSGLNRGQSWQVPALYRKRPRSNRTNVWGVVTRLTGLNISW